MIGPCHAERGPLKGESMVIARLAAAGPVAGSVAGLLCGLLVVLLLAVPFSPALSEPVGMSYLRIGAGAEAVGMADAVVSNVDGPLATYWNPAALAFLTNLQASAVHNESFQSVRQEFAGLVRPIGPVGVGLSFHGTWTDNLDAYDEQANFLGHFGYYGVAVAGSAGYSLNDVWGVGASVKYLREAIDVFDASGIAFDLGVQARNLLPRLDVGVALLHAGGSMQYIDQSFDLPTAVQGGASYHFPLSRMKGEALIAAEIEKARDEDANLHLGFEYRLQQAARMRVGYRSAMDTQDVSFGLGFLMGKMQADYAYVPFGEDLGSQHRIGLTYRR
jgi:hypothetical protein